jgi:hypothetical protein
VLAIFDWLNAPRDEVEAVCQRRFVIGLRFGHTRWRTLENREISYRARGRRGNLLRPTDAFGEDAGSTDFAFLRSVEKRSSVVLP